MKGSTNRLGETVGWLRSSVGSPQCPLFGSNITQTELFLQLVLPLLPFFLGRASPAQCRVWVNKHSLPATRTTRKKRVGHTNLPALWITLFSVVTLNTQRSLIKMAHLFGKLAVLITALLSL
jgi:hypothetical protein